jgi:hypothetical protein
MITKTKTNFKKFPFPCNTFAPSANLCQWPSAVETDLQHHGRECANNAEQDLLEATEASPPAKRFTFLAKRTTIKHVMDLDDETQLYCV